MKKLTYLFLAVVPIGFIACSSDDDGDNNPVSDEKNLIGTWDLVEFIWKGEAEEDSKLVKSEINSLDLEGHLNLKADDTFTLYTNKGTLEKTYTVDNETITDTITTEETVQKGNWEVIDGKKLILQDGEVIADILKLDGKQLIIEVNNDKDYQYYKWKR